MEEMFTASRDQHGGSISYAITKTGTAPAVAADAALKTRLAAMATSPDGRVDVAELDGLFEASMNDAIGEAKRRLGL